MSSNDHEDETRFHVLKSQLTTALVGDILDSLGYRKQFLPPNITPLSPGSKIAGRAMPVQEADYISSIADASCSRGPLSNQDFGLMIDALDGLKRNEIYIATAASSSISSYAFWGGLMSTRAKYLECAGAILNGYARDTSEIKKLGFPVWCTGFYAQDQKVRGKVIDFRCPIEIGGVPIMPGDLIFADDEGVLIIPREVEAKAIELAVAKASAEDGFASAVQNGMSVRDAFQKFGVL